jgi:uncharacterized membrane protein
VTEDSFLIEVQIGTFTAIVPPFHMSSVEDSNIVLNKFLLGDKQGAFEQALSMFIDSLAPEKVNDFYSLKHREMIILIADWIST